MHAQGMHAQVRHVAENPTQAQERRRHSPHPPTGRGRYPRAPNPRSHRRTASSAWIFRAHRPTSKRPVRRPLPPRSDSGLRYRAATLGRLQGARRSRHRPRPTANSRQAHRRSAYRASALRAARRRGKRLQMARFPVVLLRVARFRVGRCRMARLRMAGLRMARLRIVRFRLRRPRRYASPFRSGCRRPAHCLRGPALLARTAPNPGARMQTRVSAIALAMDASSGRLRRLAAARRRAD